MLLCQTIYETLLSSIPNNHRENEMPKTIKVLQSIVLIIVAIVALIGFGLWWKFHSLSIELIEEPVNVKANKVYSVKLNKPIRRKRDDVILKVDIARGFDFSFKGQTSPNQIKLDNNKIIEFRLLGVTISGREIKTKVIGRMGDSLLIRFTIPLEKTTKVSEIKLVSNYSLTIHKITWLDYIPLK